MAETEMRKIDYKEGRKLEQTHVCKECGGGLVTAWARISKDTAEGNHILKCSEDYSHDGEVRKGYLSYHEQPIEIKNAMDRKERNRNGNSTSTTR